MSQTPSAGTLLVLATYGLEIVEVGGTVARHVRAGGRAHATVTLARPEARDQIARAAALLGATVQFMDFAIGTVAPDVESKLRFIRVIRQVRPDVVVTQDPEHAFGDLDPDRRQAMILYLEALALAGREFAPERLADLPPHPIPTVYYMTPDRPNCVVDITETVGVKERALAELSSQHAFSARMMRRRLPGALLASLAGVPAGADDEALGLALHRQMDRALHLYHGLMSHSARAVLAEPFRREGVFTLSHLVP
ncbi:MAG: GlcNAc-PI de-N-acetylase [Armatimonadota bacterium]|nr:GlcNAc-PI de-N-acetylase [Armatimonadota bacterium]MDR7421284.1 GlcNAc-PI de-N-acetylase [Armatimonadota bacterium]MDR7454083.1 GlcNAc-PI de-N-acetylase [Armatimonadota bacterium]MDR7455793.1 GlcNAc-PI de-N-acetylase [Armatimonadota bacterium]MDR7496423.1 GlcNAc-PI de-N-acetylase [Armatimonadota bacterium]